MANTRKQVTPVPVGFDARRGIVESYEVKGYSSKACQLDEKALELGFKPDFRLNIMKTGEECIIEAVLPTGETDIYLSLTNYREADDVARMRGKPTTLAPFAAARLGPAVREYIDAKRL